MSEQTATASTDPLLGTVLANRYQIESKLGEGAMGTVYKARHVKVGRPFAIKVLHHQHRHGCGGQRLVAVGYVTGEGHVVARGQLHRV